MGILCTANIAGAQPTPAMVIASGAEPNSIAVMDEPAFTAAIRHINAAISGDQAPRLLAVDISLATAGALHDVAHSFALAVTKPRDPSRARGSAEEADSDVRQ
jgi:hypothetical protein